MCMSYSKAGRTSFIGVCYIGHMLGWEELECFWKQSKQSSSLALFSLSTHIVKIYTLMKNWKATFEGTCWLLVISYREFVVKWKLSISINKTKKKLTVVFNRVLWNGIAIIGFDLDLYRLMTAKKLNDTIFQCKNNFCEMNKMLKTYIWWINSKTGWILNARFFQRLLKMGPFSNVGERTAEKLISD